MKENQQIKDGQNESKSNAENVIQHAELSSVSLPPPPFQLTSGNTKSTGNGRSEVTEGFDLSAEKNVGLEIPGEPHSEVAQMSGLHGDAQVPDASSQGTVRSELDPGRVESPLPSGSGSTAPPVVHEWDGASQAGVVSAAAQTARDLLRQELTDAMQAHLDGVMPGIHTSAAAPRANISDFEGAGDAAKEVVDQKYHQYVHSAAGPTPNFNFITSGPNQTLWDATDPDQRIRADAEIDQSDLAGWIASTDSACQAAQASHHFNQDVEGEQQDFFRNEILNAFVTANDADLYLYDQYGFAISADGIVISTELDTSLDQTSTGGEPSQAMRATQWGAFHTLVHEYIHQLEHPNIHGAREDGDFNSRIIGEGFCEMYTKEVLQEVLPTADSNVNLITLIEGGIYTPPTTQAMIGPYSAGSYAQYLSHAENIRNEIGVEGAKAAYFQGHVEYLGLDHEGEFIAPRSGSALAIPPGINTMPQLSTATGVPVDDLKSANDMTEDDIPLPMIRAEMPGCSEHTVVFAGGDSETLTDIATQHGLPEASIERANPTVDFSNLSQEQILLIPAS